MTGIISNDILGLASTANAAANAYRDVLDDDQSSLGALLHRSRQLLNAVDALTTAIADEATQ